METTRVIESHDIDRQIRELVDYLRSLAKEGRKVARMPDGEILSSSKTSAALRIIDSSGLRGSILSLVKDGCMRSERVGAGSTDLVISFAAQVLDAYRVMISLGKTPSESFEKVRSAVSELISKISLASRPLSDSVLRRVLRDLMGDLTLADVVVEAAKLAGNECKIFVEPSPSVMTTVERIEGHSFTVKPDFSLYQNSRWIADDAKCFVVDGMIENTSEIDTLLKTCYEERRPMAIFARGFGPDVISTIRANWVRGTLNVMPIEVSYDLESANVLKDIAIVAGTDVISSLKGELISTVKYEKIPTVKRVSCMGYTASIIPSAVSNDISTHLAELQQKRMNEGIDTIVRVLDNRIRSLSAATVIIRVGALTGPQSVESLQRVDLGLRLLRAMLSNGVVRLSDIPDDEMGLRSGLVGYEFPALSAAAAVRFGSSAALSMVSIGAGIVLDHSSEGS